MRSLWINLHLYAAAFMAPALLLVAISGGLYLIGVKGKVVNIVIDVPGGRTIDQESETLEADVRELLSSVGIEHEFEYLKVRGNTLVTRPTSRVHYAITVLDDSTTVSRHEPDFQKRMIELHKGHGPLMFKTFQKALAVGLLFIVLSGLWLGLSSTGLRIRTLATSAAGTVVFFVLVLLA